MAFSKRVREKVYQKYNGHCAYCGCELQYKDMPAVFHRKNGKPWKVTILLPDFMHLVSIQREYYRLIEQLEKDEVRE